LRCDILSGILTTLIYKMLYMLKKGSTFVLKAVVLFMGAVILALCIFALPNIWRGGSAEFPEASRSLLIIIIGVYATVIPFFIALWQTMKLLSYIDTNKAFSDLSVTALKNIKYCAIAIGVLYLGGVPLLIPIAEADDAPGLLLFGFIIACAPFIIAIFAAVLQRLLHSAIEMKSENELTV
jgi:hypothetical protein